jgi:hypothetical protein
VEGRARLAPIGPGRDSASAPPPEQAPREARVEREPCARPQLDGSSMPTQLRPGRDGAPAPARSPRRRRRGVEARVEREPVVLPWIHRVFALMKRWGLGTYHGLRRKHVDTYLGSVLM